MKQIEFQKYQGTGNDFIMIFNMENQIKLSSNQIQKLCHRKFGIGADGVILIEPDSKTDFYVNYFNSDGTQSFCGNGSRCAVKFAMQNQLVDSKKCTFNAIDGEHTGEILENGEVKISMGNVTGIENLNDDFIINTGSPHFIQRTTDLQDIDIIKRAHLVRYHERFFEDGINVNFIETVKGETHIRTYERGVENETLSCGTGVTAVALAISNADGEHAHKVVTKGGELTVSLRKKSDLFYDIYLTGASKMTFFGTFSV